jgi:hypothetical protein
LTEDGRRASSRNAIKQVLFSPRSSCSEDSNAYDRLRNAYPDEWRPATPEEGLVLDMVNARWRLNRIQHLITSALEQYVAESSLGWRSRSCMSTRVRLGCGRGEGCARGR